MRRWMISGISLAACMAAMAHAQSAPQASDSWQRPAASSSVAYGSSAVNTARDGSRSAFRFKSDDKSYDPHVMFRSPRRSNGRPDTLCESNPTASTCRQVQPPPPGQGR